MSPFIQAVRSLGTEFALRLYIPILAIVLISVAGLLGVSIWLATISLWWIILVVLVSIVSVAAIVILVAAWVAIKLLTPIQTKAQRKMAKSLVDKIQGVAEVTATPKFILMFRVMKDVVVPSNRGFIGSISQDTLSLSYDFAELRDSFK